MSPNDLGSFQVLEGCRRIQIKDVLKQAKKKMMLSLSMTVLESNNQEIHLSTTQTNFSGKRLWFLCPRCGTRRSVLYSNPISEAIECRKCLGISYKQQRYKGML